MCCCVRKFFAIRKCCESQCIYRSIYFTQVHGSKQSSIAPSIESQQQIMVTFGSRIESLLQTRNKIFKFQWLQKLYSASPQFCILNIQFLQLAVNIKYGNILIISINLTPVITTGAYFYYLVLPGVGKYGQKQLSNMIPNNKYIHKMPPCSSNQPININQNLERLCSQ